MICIFIIYIIIAFILGVYYSKKNKESEISSQYWVTRDLLDDFRKREIGLEEFIPALKKRIKCVSEFEELKDDKEMLRLRLSEAKKELIKREEEKQLDYIQAQRDQEQKRLEEIELRKRQIAWQIETKKRQFLEKLNTYNNRVFKKDNLSKKEYQALMDNGFTQVNEYCVLEKKRIPVLVKPFGNHSISHEFLVWSAERLIKKTEGVRKIQEHLTKDADLTFEFRGKEFALEIEKGDLLRKKQQLKEKLDYLNKKYPKRWMFIVSNRNFLTKYKKFGFTSNRSRMSENLAKLLKIIHTEIPDV
jgi:hypothetical protein